MAKLIRQIHDLVDLAIDKGVTDYVSRPQIDNAIDEGQMMLYRKFISEFPRTKRVRNYLLPFMKHQSITITANVGSLASDFEHESEAYVTVASIKYQVRFKELGFFRRAVQDPVDVPTTTNPIAVIYYDSGRKIEVAPQITPVELNYFIRPPKPEYATMIDGNGNEVYDDTSSTDVSWSAILHDLIVENSLLMLGINLRDPVVMRAGIKSETKEMSL